MSLVPALVPTPEIGLYVTATGIVLLLLTALGFYLRSLLLANHPPASEPALPRKTGFKPPSGAGNKPPSAAGRKSGFKPPSHSGNTPTRRPTLAPPDDEEAYLRENSMLPYSPEVAEGGSDPFDQGGFRERRGAPRRSGNPVDVLLSDAKAEVEPL